MGFLLDNWQSLALYILVFSTSAGLVYLASKYASSRKYLSWGLTSAGLALPIVLAGIRYNVGHDYGNYVGMLERVQEGTRMWPRPIEPLSSLVINISAAVGGSVMMFTLFAIITIIFIYLALKKILPTDPLYVALGWFMYLCIGFPTTLNAVRSGVSVSVAIFALSQLVDVTVRYRLVKFIGWVVVASLFHASALMALPIGLTVYLASRDKRLDVKLGAYLFGVFVIGALIFPLFGDLFAVMPVESIRVYARYFMDAGNSFYLTKVGLAMLALLAVTLYVNATSLKDNPKLQVLYAMAIFYVPVTIIIGWLAYYTGTSRLAFFLDPIIIAVTIYAFKRLWDKRLQSRKLALLAASFVVAFSLVVFVRNAAWAQAVPYQTIFSQKATTSEIKN